MNNHKRITIPTEAPDIQYVRFEGFWRKTAKVLAWLIAPVAFVIFAYWLAYQTPFVIQFFVNS